MIGLNAQKALEPMLNMRCLGLVIMSLMVILQFYGAKAATGYKPSQFQEDKGDFSAVPKGGPFQRTGRHSIYELFKIFIQRFYAKHLALKLYSLHQWR